MFDVAIIGAGIAGSAIARQLSKYDLKTVVLEKGVEVCQGTTKANSAIVHGGFDAKEGTLKAKLNVLGCKMYPSICKELSVEYKNNGSLVLAFNENDMEHIHELYERGLKNGASDIEIINGEKVKEIEPNVNEDVVGALWCKSSGIVCPFNLNIAFMENAIINGVELRLESEVLDIKKIEDDYFEIKTNKEIIKSKYVINAAGVYSDKINNLIGGSEFHIIPRKGEYKILDKSEGYKASHTLFTCPTEKGKGVLVTKTVHGNLLVGPNAQVVEKDDITTSKSGLKEIMNGGRKSVPNIDFSKTITSFAGVRATPNTGDFMIFKSRVAKGFINVAGIESPGLASAPAIALYVEDLLKDLIHEDNKELNVNKNFNPIRLKNKPFMEMSLEEQKEILSKDGRYKTIICRCENITEGEIVDAINRPCGAKTVDGVKRRIRPGMGRCQGGFCGPKVVEIIARELNITSEEVLKDYENSKMLVGKAKEVRGETVEI
ncbi:NAD(P)/FAD-dependent oxidoreductase [Terrisporobacter glycolicus]|uniref:L-2-hydroxyglutarate dehydrogenase n=1 Tax=Terrisporobacter glycolicus ATCC 14880 = DSM 1288 TaxID=1121315 RepID=A0ABZ2ER06_9FIRM|nr:NAD(P)/FAD-dependent oxidoreductase [Terrisporobacter glycolicus]